MIEKAGLEEITAKGRGPSRLRGFVVLLLLVFLSGVGYWFWSQSRTASTTPQWITQKAEMADLTITVAATGTVEPTNQVDISSELSGTIRSVEVDYNDEVRTGQILARLDTDKLEATVELRRAALVSAEARVAEAQATLDEKRQAFERTQTLTDRGIASLEQFIAAKTTMARAETALTSARADVRVAEANLKVEEANLAKACICSPIDGVILSRNVDPGQIVASSLQAPVLFTIAEDLRQMRLLVDIDEADIGDVKVGDNAVFTVEAWREREFPASISEIRYAPETVEGVVTYKAVLQIENTELLLRPGMTATAEITVARFDNVLSVPNAALRFQPPSQADGAEEAPTGLLGLLFRRPPSADPVTSNEALPAGARQIWVLVDGSPRAATIRTGESDGFRTRILDGELKEGDLVVTGTGETE